MELLTAREVGDLLDCVMVELKVPLSQDAKLAVDIAISMLKEDVVSLMVRDLTPLHAAVFYILDRILTASKQRPP